MKIVETVDIIRNRSETRMMAQFSGKDLNEIENDKLADATLGQHDPNQQLNDYSRLFLFIAMGQFIEITPTKQEICPNNQF